MAFGVWGHKQTSVFWMLVEVSGLPVEYISHSLTSVRVQVNGTVWRAQKGCLPVWQPLLGSAPCPALGFGYKDGPAQVSVTQVLRPEGGGCHGRQGDRTLEMRTVPCPETFEQRSMLAQVGKAF